LEKCDGGNAPFVRDKPKPTDFFPTADSREKEEEEEEEEDGSLLRSLWSLACLTGSSAIQQRLLSN
jgi:hypothetical protein